MLILASGQALFQIASVMVMTVGGLAGAQLAGSARWATLPVAAMFLGTAMATFPASMWMARAGRRTGFIAGTLLGAAGGALAALAIHQQSLLLLSAGTFLVGTYQGFAQFYRFAASEMAVEAHRPRAISLVLAGGVLAAIVGPQLARVGGPLLSPEYVGTFLILSVVSLGAAAVLAQLSPIPSSGQSRPVTTTVHVRCWHEIVLQPTYLIALFGAATGYGVMILAMTATPLAMIHHQHGLATAATVIQLHTLGMFLPSFFTGDLIARFGVVRVMLAGVVLLLGHVLAALSGTQFLSFAGALILLGVGWNFLYVGGTTLLTRTYTAQEAARAQATNDMTIFAVGLACSLGAGALLDTLGWQRLNLLLVPWLFAAGVALLWFAVRDQREAVD